MHIRYTLQSAYIGLRTNTSRSLLTILGIVIGITAIMVVMSVGNGAQDLIIGQIEGFGAETISVESGREPTGPSDIVEAFTDSLKERELQAIERLRNHGIELISPLTFTSATVAYGSETKRSTVQGISPDFLEIFNIEVEAGSMLTEDDVRLHAPVALIGAEVKEELFGLSDAIGSRVKIKNHTFRIVGVLKEKGQTAFLNIDDAIFIPYTTVQDYLTGTKHFQNILVKATSQEAVGRVSLEIETTLRELHNITDPDKDDFHVATQADALEIVGVITTSLKAMLVSIAAISLLVGGIGIMNIMLVSVTERTREIGLRKAVGAKYRDILLQFMSEAVLLTVAGGIIGIATGAGISYLAAVILSVAVVDGWSFSFPFSAMLLGLGVSMGVGLVFGLYPARQAASKSPMEALRYE